MGNLSIDAFLVHNTLITLINSIIHGKNRYQCIKDLKELFNDPIRLGYLLRYYGVSEELLSSPAHRQNLEEIAQICFKTLSGVKRMTDNEKMAELLFTDIKNTPNDYLKKYKDVRESGENPLVHYVLHGRKEGREVNNKYDKIRKDLKNKNKILESYNKLFNYLFVFFF